MSDDIIIFQRLGSFVVLNQATHALEEVGRGDVKLVLNPSEPNQLWLLIPSLNSRTPAALSETIDSRSSSRFSVSLKLMDSPELPFLTVVFSGVDDLDAFIRVIEKGAELGALPVNDAAEEEPEQLEVATIQPVRAAEYFQDVVGTLGPWMILVSSKAISFIRQVGDSKITAIVKKKIGELSRGELYGDNAKSLTDHPRGGVPIYEAKLSRDLRIVWSIDIYTDQANGVDHQAIKIWAILNHRQIANRIWQKLVDHPSRRTAEYCFRRNLNINNRSRDPHAPATFKTETSQIVDTPDGPILDPDVLSDDDFLELHHLLALEKFTPCTASTFLAFQSVAANSHFFTLAPKEQEIMNHKGACFVLGRGGTGKTTCMLFKLLGTEAKSSHGLSRKPRSLFSTQSPVLALKVGEQYQKLSKSLEISSMSKSQLKTLQATQHTSDASGSSSMARNAERKIDLPTRWSLLEENHFPLFVSFDQLSSLLESDLVPLGLRTRQTLIDFRVFELAYFPRFDEKLVEGIEPTMLWNELLGVIKGSEETLKEETGFLTQDSYEALSPRSQPTFASKRGIIYDLFLRYEKLKAERFERDAADRTHAILRGFQRDPSIIDRVDFVYVDEAQDNLIIDLALIRKISSFSRGVFICGDTAQTISAGSSFKFSELTSLFYRLEKDSLAVRSGLREAEKPGYFQLTRNYRSHGGICEVADFIVSFLRSTFPNSIDAIKPEEGLILGPRPAFFEKREKGHEEFKEIFGTAGKLEMEFGAQQCILVRDHASKAQLQALVGEENIGEFAAIAKGLEFQDVLLYGFFDSSPAQFAQWRVVLRDIPNSTAPIFEESKHGPICQELKKLYVAVTRARNHIWIWDEGINAEPMRDLLVFKHLIEVIPASSPLPQLAKESTPLEWLERARELHSKGVYDQAVYAFNKAGRPLESRQLFKAVASSFEECATEARKSSQMSLASECFTRAGECYERGEAFVKAGKSFEEAKHYNAAALSYHRHRSTIDDAVRLATDLGLEIEEKIRGDIIQTGKEVYLSDISTAPELPFDSVEDEIAFMEDYALNAYLPQLLEEFHRYDEAADLALIDGRIVDSVRLYLLSRSRASKALALDGILVALWRTLPLGVSSSDLDELSRSEASAFVTSGKEIFARTDYVEEEEVRNEKRNQLDVFAAALRLDDQSLFEAATSLRDRGSVLLSLLAVDKGLNLTPEPRRDVPVLTTALELGNWTLSFVDLLVTRIRRFDPTNDQILCSLLGVLETGDSGYFRLAERSILSSQKPSKPSKSRILSASVVQIRAQAALEGLVKPKLARWLENWNLSTLLVDFASSRSLVSLPGKPTIKTMSDELALLFLEVVLEDSLREHGGVVHEPSHWVIALSNILIPSSLARGSSSNVVVSRIAGGNRALPLLQVHLVNAFKELDASTGSPSVCLEKAQQIINLIDCLCHSEIIRRLVITSQAAISSDYRVFHHSRELLAGSGQSSIKILLSHFGLLRLHEGPLQHALYRGLEFVEFVVERKIGSLRCCLEVVERIVLQLVVDLRIGFGQTLDGLTAPLSYLRKIHEVPQGEYGRAELPQLDGYARKIVRSLSQTLSSASTERSHDLFERVIRLEVFYAENGNLSFRRSLLAFLSKLRLSSRYNPDPRHSSFVHAPTWEDVFDLFLQSTPPSLDPAFTLLDSQKHHRSRPTFATTSHSSLKIRFDSWNHLEEQLILRATEDDLLRCVDNSPPSTPLVRPMSPSPLRIDEEDPTSSIGARALLDIPSTFQVFESKVEEEKPSPEFLAVVLQLQAHFRASRLPKLESKPKGKKGWLGGKPKSSSKKKVETTIPKPKSKVEEPSLAKFDEVALQFWGADAGGDSRSSEDRLKDRRWAMTLRGPLAHLVFALETVFSHTAKAKKGLRKPGPSFVEGEEYTQILNLSRTSGNLVKDVLLPTSRIVAAKSLPRLRAACLQIPHLVTELVRRVGDARIHDQPSVSQEMIWNQVSDHLEIGTKGLLVDAVEPKVVVVEPSVPVGSVLTNADEEAAFEDLLHLPLSQEESMSIQYLPLDIVEHPQVDVENGLGLGRVDDGRSEGSFSSAEAEPWNEGKGEIQLVENIREGSEKGSSVEEGGRIGDEQSLELPVLGF
ncbi:hypothetical protein BDY24DRAFT_411475 [Mrakia frigida]|uniref:uncharacterized protein n=1 Tax=Mrakia frigida TaxID=29902 RepID=UPI003FCC1E28